MDSMFCLAFLDEPLEEGDLREKLQILSKIFTI